MCPVFDCLSGFVCVCGLFVCVTGCVRACVCMYVCGFVFVSEFDSLSMSGDDSVSALSKC